MAHPVIIQDNKQINTQHSNIAVISDIIHPINDQIKHGIADEHIIQPIVKQQLPILVRQQENAQKMITICQIIYINNNSHDVHRQLLITIR